MLRAHYRPRGSGCLQSISCGRGSVGTKTYPRLVPPPDPLSPSTPEQQSQLTVLLQEPPVFFSSVNTPIVFCPVTRLGHFRIIFALFSVCLNLIEARRTVQALRLYPPWKPTAYPASVSPVPRGDMRLLGQRRRTSSQPYRGMNSMSVIVSPSPRGDSDSDRYCTCSGCVPLHPPMNTQFREPTLATEGNILPTILCLQGTMLFLSHRGFYYKNILEEIV